MIDMARFGHLSLSCKEPIAHFQKEWQTGARMGARSIMGSFEGAVARAKSSRSRKST